MDAGWPPNAGEQERCLLENLDTTDQMEIVAKGLDGKRLKYRDLTRQ